MAWHASSGRLAAYWMPPVAGVLEAWGAIARKSPQLTDAHEVVDLIKLATLQAFVAPGLFRKLQMERLIGSLASSVPVQARLLQAACAARRGRETCPQGHALPEPCSLALLDLREAQPQQGLRFRSSVFAWPSVHSFGGPDTFLSQVPKTHVWLTDLPGFVEPRAR